MFGHKDGKIGILITNTLVDVGAVKAELNEALESEKYSKEELRAIIKHNVKRLNEAYEKLTKIVDVERKIIDIFKKEF